MSSFIAFELDALNRAPSVARSANVTEETIIAGLVRLWAWCFREKVATASADQLRGHFGADVTTALTAFGFLEPIDGAWRVLGAERYLRIAAGRSAGGKAASGNLKKGTKRAAFQAPPQAGVYAGADSRLAPGSLPADSRQELRLTPGLSPNTEHLTKRLPASAAKAPPQLVEKLATEFERVVGSKYLFQGAKDGAALKALCAAETPDEILVRWGRGLRATGFKRISDIAQLRSKWNELASGATGIQTTPSTAVPKLRDL